MREWRFEIDKDKKGQSPGWAKANFDDTKWRTTDPVVDSWSSLGCHNYHGSKWYRTTAEIPAAKGKKTWLWIGATDGTAKVSVNGKHIPSVAPYGKTADEFDGYMAPASWNITARSRMAPTRSHCSPGAGS